MKAVDTNWIQPGYTPDPQVLPLSAHVTETKAILFQTRKNTPHHERAQGALRWVWGVVGRLLKQIQILDVLEELDVAIRVRGVGDALDVAVLEHPAEIGDKVETYADDFAVGVEARLE
jgi:hypothetical protein